MPKKKEKTTHYTYKVPAGAVKIAKELEFEERWQQVTGFYSQYVAKHGRTWLGEKK